MKYPFFFFLNKGKMYLCGFSPATQKTKSNCPVINVVSGEFEPVI